GARGRRAARLARARPRGGATVRGRRSPALPPPRRGPRGARAGNAARRGRLVGDTRLRPRLHRRRPRRPAPPTARHM
ncbi:MAG: hypothetical protein AVDCRST_MAG40-1263, partial [uncultured Gemmatimonadaceae bacterium]